MSHTPGPWSVLYAPTWMKNPSIESAAPASQGAIATLSSRRGGRDLPIEEKLANARLIAAAPDLLALAREMVAAIEGRPPRSPFLMVDDLKAAIARAEGR